MSTMQKHEFIEFLKSNLSQNDLTVSFPTLNWVFQKEAYEHIDRVMQALNDAALRDGGATAVIIKQPATTGVCVVAGLYEPDHMGSGRFTFLHPVETQCCFETCHETGETLPPVEGYKYVPPDVVLGAFKGSPPPSFLVH